MKNKFKNQVLMALHMASSFLCIFIVAYAIDAGSEERKANSEFRKAEITLEKSIFKQSAARASASIERQIESIKALSRGMILDYQAREIVRVLDAECGNQITKDIIMAMAHRESRWNPRALGLQGERGVMQIKPHIAAPHLKAIGAGEIDLYDPIVNIRVAILELKRLVALMNDLGLAIACYAGGPTKAIYYSRDIIFKSIPQPARAGRE